MATVQRFRGDVEFYGNAAVNLSIEPLTFYAAPTAQGTGDGLSSGNAATLQTILTDKIKTATYVVVKLASGNHVLSSTMTIADQVYLRLEATSYDAQNPPIICTTHSTGANISEDTSGNPSASQACAAHGYDEYPLLIQNSHVSLFNVWLHGIRYCLKALNSQVELHGDTFFKLWGYNISSTQHDGIAIYAEKSQITGENATKFWIYHPQYQSTSDTFVNGVSPLFLKNGTKMAHSGTVTWVANTQTNIPTDVSDLYEQVCGTGIIAVRNSEITLSNIIIDNVMDVFSLANGAKFYGTLSQQGTGKVRNLIQANTTVLFHLKLNSEIVALNTTGGTVVYVNSNSYGQISSNAIKGYGASGMCLWVHINSRLFLHTVNILAENRASNLGFATLFTASFNSEIVFAGTAETRNSGTDKIAVSSMGSTITQISGTNTCSAPIYTVGSGGRFIEANGTVRS